MEVKINQESLDVIKSFLADKPEAPDNIRIYVAGMGCSGPSFGLALDDSGESDVTYEQDGVTFLFEEALFEQYGDISIEHVGKGFLIQPANQPEGGCGSCSGCH